MARGLNSPRLILVTDSLRLADPLPAIAKLPHGAWVLFRHYDHPQREALGRAIARLCRAKRLSLLVAGDFALALRLKAQGVHLPEYGLRHPAPALRLWARHKGQLTAACHSRQALRQAKDWGVSAAFLSPVFPTQSHPGQGCLGPMRFRQLTRQSAVPVIALGGVNRQTIALLRHSGATGIAAIAGFSS